ncbi:MAG: peptidoglycan editing factor PgeF [Proteobacteria bacterium]|nr:peptidoglycan editing factor PgeF [Pseudomonadota bacterium]
MIRRYTVSDLQTRKGLGFYQAPHFEAGDSLIHAFTSRQGGVSPPPFHALNLGTGTGDQETHVKSNREILMRTFGLDPSVLFTANQVHEADILILESSTPAEVSKVSRDAIITQRRGIAIGVLTADCVPILVFDPVHRAVAAIHAGWKGIAGDLVGKTIRTMVDQFETRPEKLRAAVGPSIGPRCYEVDDQVRSAFSHHPDGWSKWAEAVSSRAWMFNLSQASVDLLLGSGVRPDNLVFLDVCTHCHPHLFYSHRRDNGRTGRQISFVMLK